MNQVPPEPIVRNVNYYLRARPQLSRGELRAIDLGCGGGATMAWLLSIGIGFVEGIDIAPFCVELAAERISFLPVIKDRWGVQVASVTKVPFPDAHFDIAIEANVFQHLSKEDRDRAFAEVKRILKPGGLFAGYMEAKGDSGQRGKGDRPYEVGRIPTHFFSAEEIRRGLKGMKVVDISLLSYRLPREEARRRGYRSFVHKFWVVWGLR